MDLVCLLIFRGFASSKKAIITNARCLTEGVDIPAVDCVAFIDPKHSMVDIVQASGRAMRKFPGKKCGYIMVPIEISTDEDLDSKINISAYRTIGKVIAILSSQDERLVDEIKSIKSGTISQGSIIEIESNLIDPLKINVNQIKDSIASEIWEKSSRINFLNYEDAKELVKKSGIKTQQEWKKLVTDKTYEPFGIPKSPREYYVDKGWKGWGDFLGTDNPGGRKVNVIDDFQEVKRIVQSAKISSQPEYYSKYKKIHEGLVYEPSRKFLNEWTGWSDFLGENYKGRFKHAKMVPYKEAKQWAQRNKIEALTQYRNSYKNAEINLPYSPYDFYKGEYNHEDFYFTDSDNTAIRSIRGKYFLKNNLA